MNVASLELCRELYELSGWRNTEHNYPGEKISKGTAGTKDDPHIVTVIPAYDLGYLLRKLPMQIPSESGDEDDNYCFQLTEGLEAKWQIDYRDRYDGQFTAVVDDIPENAACQLAIELFKQGVLTPTQTEDGQHE